MPRPFADPGAVDTRLDRPIEDYGLIGDTRTAALVSSDGAIDWMCVPRFDGPPLFGRLVGGSDAGTFRLGPAGAATVVARRYRPGTASLETTWRTEQGRLTLRDAMVANVAGAADADDPARSPADRRRWPGHRSGRLRSSLRRTTPQASPAAPWRHPGVRVGGDGDRPALRSATAGHPGPTHDRHRHPRDGPSPSSWPSPIANHSSTSTRRPHGRRSKPTRQWWRSWCDEVDHGLPHRDVVVRSLLTLRLLTYSPSGAPVAAPTTSLPEHLGGIRNWDYRFAWPRDASIGIAAFLGVGKVDEARRFLAWLLHASRLERPRLPVLFTLDGRHPGPEHTLEGWPGYAHSQPVRIGNGAADQHQLDGYGWVLDAAWMLVDAGHHLYSETWRAMRGFADEVAERWSDARCRHLGDPRRRCPPRALQADGLARPRPGAAHRRHPSDPRPPTRPLAGPARGDRRRGHHARLRPRARQLTPAPTARPTSTPPCSCSRCSASNPSTHRASGAASTPSPAASAPAARSSTATHRARTACPARREHSSHARSGWCRPSPLTGRTAEAHELFAELCALASPLGLYGEEMDPASHRHLGNYPQALTHAALLQAALALDRQPSTTNHGVTD